VIVDHDPAFTIAFTLLAVANLILSFGSSRVATMEPWVVIPFRTTSKIETGKSMEGRPLRNMVPPLRTVLTA
jgi:hypothetical protein